jgi:hypothetical protein
VKARRRVEEAARWRLAIGEPLLAGGFTWVAFPRPQVRLVFLARRPHFVGLTDRRLLLWSRPHEVRPADDSDLVLDAPFAEVTLEQVTAWTPMLQLRIRASTGRRLVLEFRPRDRRLGHKIAAALGNGDAGSDAAGDEEPVVANDGG